MQKGVGRMEPHVNLRQVLLTSYRTPLNFQSSLDLGIIGKGLCTSKKKISLTLKNAF